MKLETLQEAKYADPQLAKLPNVLAAMRMGAKIKKDFSLDDLAWICALDNTQYIGEADHDTIASQWYDPNPGYKGNPKEIEEYLDGPFGDGEEEAAYWLKNWIEQAKL